ncbi:hypothetical protein PILCRDRAFT_93688 [Piloderma croceum F 1598]|uniref:Uncharacterized protein n=1 Tax=Piloderma croceum (strain F 1598) TaxID=765440 RepID=A0A0C3EGP4_PILCF|nr:hypothetical protein PILCRDRAFT_93688 [Piloderma croceum F 1598]
MEGLFGEDSLSYLSLRLLVHVLRIQKAWLTSSGLLDLAGLDGCSEELGDIDQLRDMTLALSIYLRVNKTYEPAKSVQFQCTMDLKGRLYPHPCGPDLYLLDFIDHNGARRDVTNLYIFPHMYRAAEDKSQPLQPMGSLQGSRGPVDIYTLTPGYEYDISDGSETVLKTIAFTYERRGDLQPRVF